MISKIITFVIPNLLILLNLKCFFSLNIENIVNILFIAISILVLYFFIFKYKQPDYINSEKNQEIILYLTFFLLPWITMQSVYLYTGNIIINYLILLSIQGIFYVIFRNVKVATIMQLIISFILIFITENSIILRGMPFLPVDILSAKLGMTLSNYYNIVITSNIIRAFVTAYTLGYVVIKVNVGKASSKDKNKISLICFTSALALCFIIYCINFDESDYLFNVIKSIKTNGMPYNFVINFKYMFQEEPENYSVDLAEKILQEYSGDEYSGEKEFPNVIAIMNESFSDLNNVLNIKTNKDPLEFFNSLKDNTVRGSVLVPSQTGPTANTEFEFLTGLSENFFAYGTVPYMQYINKENESIASDLSGLGYKTYAVHPFYDYSWRRNTVYDYLGFDNFISLKDFIDIDQSKDYNALATIGQDMNTGEVETYRNYITDKETYKKAIELIENNDESVFVFDVTIQNHLDYNYKGDDYIETIKEANYKDTRLNQYLSSIKESDNDLKYLIDYIQNNVSEKTIILFFGDHYPYIDGISKDIDETSLNYSKIPFIIWANYDIEEKEYDLVGTQYLSAILKECAKIPLTSFDKFRKNVMEKYKAFNFIRNSYR